MGLLDVNLTENFGELRRTPPLELPCSREPTLEMMNLYDPHRTGAPDDRHVRTARTGG